MNKKFLQTAAVTMGLAAISLPLTACNMRTDNTTPQRTGIMNRQNNTQNGTNTGYQRLNNTDTGINNRMNRIVSPLPGNRFNNINTNTDRNIVRTTPLPGTNLGNTPTATANNMNDMRSKSERIERQLESLANVKDANVMVVGNTALVACDPSSTGVDVNSLRNAITQRIKSIDPSITNVVVTESADAKTSIQQMFSNMNNKSMDQITQEFNKLVKSLTPTMQ